MAATALVAGNGWIDVQFKDCFFRRGEVGIAKIDLNELAEQETPEAPEGGVG